MMATHRVKLDYNNLMSFIDNYILGAENIETVQNNAMYAATGLNLLQGYLKQLAQHAIDTNDEFLIEWCKNLMIVKEGDE